MDNLKFLKRIGHSNINPLDDDSRFFYASGMEIDAAGAYHAHNPDGKSGLDYLANAGDPGNWWALVIDNDQPTGRPLIQTAEDAVFRFRHFHNDLRRYQSCPEGIHAAM